jgi:hypothetical protein
MKKRLFFLLLTTVILTAFSQAQLTGSISGTVKDGNNKGLSSATVYLTRAADSALVKSTIADSAAFRFGNLADGIYKVTVTNIGFKKYTSEPITISGGQSAELPAITMTQSDGSAMQEVFINGKKPFIEQKIDRTVVNVEAMISASGTNAFELLGKMPGVGVDMDGNVSLKSRSGTLIYVDGKPTYLSAGDLAGYLRSMPSATIERIELIPNPPAKYDAAGSGGIINIVTKKIRQIGFNGSTNLSYGQGVYEKVNASVNLNYRLNKVNFFGNLSYSESKDFERSDKQRAYIGQDGSITSRFRQRGFTRFDRTSYNARIGFDYYRSKSTTWGVVMNGVIRPSSDKGGNTTLLLDKSFGLDSSVIFRNNSDNKWRSGNVNINMLHRFSKPGKELSFDLDYVTYKTSSDQVFDYYFYNAGNIKTDETSLMGELPRRINIYSAKADYSYPFSNGIKLETGAKSSLVKTDNKADYFNRENGSILPDYEKTNTFLYDENINAAYISAYKEFKRFEIKAGLRMENTIMKGNQLGNITKADSSFRRNYVDLFPTLFLSYRFDTMDKHQLVLSYGKRINRPSYQLLNPFLSFVDKYYQEAGNPFLRPQLSQSLELTHTYKRFLNTGVFFDYLVNSFNRVIELADSNTFINRPANIGKMSNLGLLVTVDINPTKIWSMNVYCEVGIKHVKSVFNDISVDTSVRFYSFQLRNSFAFKKGWTMEVYGYISSSDFTGQFVVRPMGEMTFAAQKKFKRSSLTLNAKDFLYTRISRGTILNIPDVDAKFDNRRDSRAVSLSFNYRFGKSNNQSRRRRGSVEDEQSRVN